MAGAQVSVPSEGKYKQTVQFSVFVNDTLHIKQWQILQDYKQRKITLHTSTSFQSNFKLNENFKKSKNFTIYREKKKICKRLCDHRMSSNSTNACIQSFLLGVKYTSGAYRGD